MKKLELFEELIKTLNVPVKKLDEDIWQIGNKKPEHLLSFLVHGNETFSLDIILNFLEQKIQDQSFLLILGNKRSYLENKRFTQRDLNRSFDENNEEKYEEKKAALIKKNLSNIKYVLDLHQTSYKCEKPFAITRDIKNGVLICQEICPSYALIFFDPKKRTSKEGLTFGEYCTSKNINFLTLEVGEKGYRPEYLTKAVLIIEKFLNLKEIPSKKLQDVEIYVTDQVILKRDKDDHLVAGLSNLSLIKKDMPIVYRKNDLIENTSKKGFILFPKYGEYQRFSIELCKVLKKIKINV